MIAKFFLEIFPSSQNGEQALEILKSGIEPRSLILHTAHKFIEAQVDNDACKHMQKIIGEYLNELELERVNNPSTSSQETTQIDERYLLAEYDKG